MLKRIRLLQNKALILFLVLFNAAPVLSGSLIIDTKSYASGQLGRVWRANTSYAMHGRAYTGELLLGHNSASFISFGNQPQALVTNPMRFCFDQKFYNDLEDFIGHAVVLEFITPRSNTLLSCSASNELVAVHPVMEKTPLTQKHLIGDIRTFAPEISYGVEFGRITNVIKNDKAIRNYFMTMQIGKSGNKFRHFAIDDRSIYKFAIKCLKKAAMVKVHYSERLVDRNTFGFRAQLFVSEIEAVGQKDVD